MKTPVFGFVGYSGAGKTTLATAVTEILVCRGMRVAVLKDAHHHVDMDTPGKDTWRYRQSGAAQVMLRTPERWILQTETPQRVDIEAVLNRFEGVDLILVEGFKNEGNFPKIEVLRKDQPKQAAPLYVGCPDIVAVATDRVDLSDAPVCLDVNDAEAVANFIVAFL